jgi:TonB family protein
MRFGDRVVIGVYYNQDRPNSPASPRRRRIVKRFSIFGVIAVSIVMATATVLAAEQVVPIGPRVNTPLPEGRRIEAHDGDVVLIDDDARVRLVRRRNGNARIIFNASERWVVLLADLAPGGGTPDGSVDLTHSWRQVEGSWPIDERWEGPLVIEDYMSPGFGRPGISFVFPAGRIQLVSGGPPQDQGALDPRALAVLTYRSSSGSGTASGTFDQLEPRIVAEVSANARSNTSYSTFTGPGGISGGASLVTGGVRGAAPSSVTRGGPELNAPVRVGGSVAMPRKIQDVAPVYPEAMRQSGLGGVVILELVIGTDGSVTSAKILRGIAEQIDQAALDAARQWRYEPTLLNGATVPVIFTATVNVQPR